MNRDLDDIVGVLHDIAADIHKIANPIKESESELLKALKYLVRDVEDLFPGIKDN